MADLFNAVEKFDLMDRLIRKGQIVRDGLNPITYHNEADLSTFSTQQRCSFEYFKRVDGLD